mmetsp:Transcript_43394/g.114496  ORF Transcript_43394/g.114496 Transcript_43394/m.114496 type:complete len:207 (+) Transcript_43394:852-1472(+)
MDRFRSNILTGEVVGVALVVTVRHGVFEIPNDLHKDAHVGCSLLDGFGESKFAAAGKGGAKIGVSSTGGKGDGSVECRRHDPRVGVLGRFVVVDKGLKVCVKGASGARSHGSIRVGTETLERTQVPVVLSNIVLVGELVAAIRRFTGGHQRNMTLIIVATIEVRFTKGPESTGLAVGVGLLVRGSNVLHVDGNVSRVGTPRHAFVD